MCDHNYLFYAIDVSTSDFLVNVMTPNVVLAGADINMTCCVIFPDRFMLHSIDVVWSYDADGHDNISENNTDIISGQTTNDSGRFRNSIIISSITTSDATDYYCIVTVANLTMVNSSFLSIQSKNY